MASDSGANIGTANWVPRAAVDRSTRLMEGLIVTDLRDPPQPAAPRRVGHILKFHAKRKPVQAAAWLVAERMVGLINAAVGAIIIARSLGPTRYAAISFFAAILFLASPLISGVQPLLLRELIGDPKSTRSALAIGRRIALPVAVAVFPLTVLATFTAGQHVTNHNERIAGLILLATILIKPWTLAEAVFQSTLTQKLLVRRRVIIAIVGTSIRIAIAVATKSAALMLIEIAAEQIAIAAVTAFKVPMPAGKRSVREKLAREWWLALGPTVLASAGVVIYMRLDQLLLAHFLLARQVGLYAMAATLAELPYFIATTAVTVLTPRLTTAFDRDQATGSHDYESEFRQVMVLLAALGTLLAAAICIAAPVVVPLVGGNAFRGAVRSLQILAWTSPFVFLGVVQGVHTILVRQQPQALERTLFAAVLNVGLNLWLIPKYGIISAAWTTVLAQVLAGCLLNLAQPSTRSVGVWQLRALLLFGLPTAVRSVIKSDVA